MVIGNLMIPSRRYMEATGTASLTCSNGHSATFDYPVRGWTSNYYTNRVEVTTLDAAQNERFKVEGYYTTELHAKDCQTGETQLVFRAPEHPAEVSEKMQYNMNSHALMLNALSDELAQKLPPTDCRFRPDLRLWE